MKKSSILSDATLLANSAELLSLIATGAASSRATLLDASGLSRVTVTQRLNALLAAGLVRETERTLPSGGRPTRVLAIGENAGVILVANIGETHIHIAAMDLQPAIVSQLTIEVSSQADPDGTLERIHHAFSDLLSRADVADRLLFAISLSLPTPVDHKRGCVVGPSVLPKWDEFDIRGWLGRHYEAPVFVENDVNLMTICEHRQNFPHVEDMFFIKAGTGIGSGIVTGGKIFRGAQGAAGDIGHIQFTSDDPPLCRCGKLGCVEARAGGWAIARDLTARGFPAENARHVVQFVENNRPEAIMLVRRAGQTIGEVASDVVSILNPSLIVIGGTLAKAGEYLLSGVRELVYQRCLPLAIRELQIVLSDPQRDSALFGAAHLVLDDIFSRGNVDALIERFVKRSETARVV
ncbi:putative NBD/HSP70 family sugar kinase [Rhizobium sp. PP-F2F-G48]|uniref:ROK family transcriptional regulator n=1 Tax=Rhizobium sp. PP-F2F-G48 TaxID=2135651 RepID=UPI00104F26A0|nr:ROK family protein [Rhizobium sp. PP-F2F-G48]TCM50811.1 putative NBD/HSP70 family sugar kinase [Rhizobium sp. PP-F2F-G48]